MRQRLYVRRAVGVVIGLVLAIALADGGWHLAARWFPPPLTIDGTVFYLDDTPSIARMPFAGLAIIALGWFLAGVVGAFAALRIAQWRPAGWIVAAAVVLLNLWIGWFMAASIVMMALAVVAPLLGCWLAERHFHRARPGDPLIN